MAVYTPFTQEDFRAVAQAFGLGEVTHAVGIPQGSINTNYRLETPVGRYFLRHTTVRSPADLAFEADLLAHLTGAQFPAPVPLRASDGQAFVEIAGGRASVFRYLVGEEIGRAAFTPAHAERLGVEVGKMHRLGESFGQSRSNPYGPDVVAGWLVGLRDCPDDEVRATVAGLEHRLSLAEQHATGLLPRGPIHADLFMDNVKWVGDRVSAFFDFEMACRDSFALDFAITLNAWCFEKAYNPALCQAFTRGYEAERRLSAEEVEGTWSRALFGAVRYTASRIKDFYLSTLPPERLFRKDFRTYLARSHAIEQMGVAGWRKLLGLFDRRVS